MQNLLNSEHFIIQSKFRWFPSLNTKFQIIDDDEKITGEIVLNPAWTSPILWIFGFLTELGLMTGGIYLMITSKSRNSLITAGIIFLFGLLLFFLLGFRNFLASRASSTIKVFDAEKNLILKAVKGWAIWRPTFTIWNTQNDSKIGQSRQSFLFGDRHYVLWDKDGKKWGSIHRRILGFQYRVKKDGTQVARFRRKLVDARKLITGVKSYTLEFQDENLNFDERALILGTLTYADVLVRQKKLSEEKQEEKTQKET